MFTIGHKGYPYPGRPVKYTHDLGITIVSPLQSCLSPCRSLQRAVNLIRPDWKPLSYRRCSILSSTDKELEVWGNRGSFSGSICGNYEHKNAAGLGQDSLCSSGASTSSRLTIPRKKDPTEKLEESHCNNPGANPIYLRTVSNFQGIDLRQSHSCSKQYTPKPKMSKRKEKQYVCGRSKRAGVTRPIPTKPGLGKEVESSVHF